VHEQRARQHERADEQEHEGIGERRERFLRGRHAEGTQSAAPSIAVSGIGSASVIHSTTTAAITAASR
jgi:hypothetical protein